MVWCVMVTTLIKAITLTYIITDIYIIIFCIHIPGKYIFFYHTEGIHGVYYGLGISLIDIYIVS